MEQSLNVKVALWHSCKALLDEVIVVRIVAFADKARCQWVSCLSMTELNSSISNRILHSDQHQGVHNHIDSGKNVSNEAKVPVGPCVTEVLCIEQ